MKKNILAIAALTLATSLAIFTSCVKENETSPVETNPTRPHLKMPESPFDNIGMMHNDLLYQVGLLRQDTLNAFFADIENKSQDEKNSMAKYIAFSITQVCEPIKDGSMSSDECESLINSTLFDLMYDTTLMSTKLFGRLDTFLSKVAFVEEIDELQTKVRTHEQEIVASAMNGEDSAFAICLNVLYHSIKFWHDAEYNKDNPWHTVIMTLNQQDKNMGFKSNKTNIFQKIGKWVESKLVKLKKKYTMQNVILADAAGALSGVGLVGATAFTSIPISAAAWSLVAPLLM